VGATACCLILGLPRMTSSPNWSAKNLLTLLRAGRLPRTRRLYVSGRGVASTTTRTLVTALQIPLTPAGDSNARGQNCHLRAVALPTVCRATSSPACLATNASTSCDAGKILSRLRRAFTRGLAAGVRRFAVSSSRACLHTCLPFLPLVTFFSLPVDAFIPPSHLSTCLLPRCQSWVNRPGRPLR